MICFLGWGLIFDSLTGNLKDLDIKWFGIDGLDENGKAIPTDMDAKRQEIAELRDVLKHKTHVLVGHNLFTDLMFLYKSFIGPLPEKVSDFQKEIHALFPLVIDTKYLATHNAGPMRSNSSLREVFDGLKLQSMPSIALHEKHISYNGVKADHEAGYDSEHPLITVKVSRTNSINFFQAG